MNMIKLLLTIFKKLTYRQVISMVLLVVGIPIIVLTSFSISNVNDDITKMEMRRHSIAFNKSLMDLLQEAQLHRGYSVSFLDGDKTMKEEMLDSQEKINHLLSLIEKKENELKTYHHTLEELNNIQNYWRVITTFIEEVEPELALGIQTDFIESIIDYIRYHADQSQLYDTDSNKAYYLIIDTTKTLPNLTETLGQIRGGGSIDSEQGNIVIKDELYSNLIYAEVLLEELKYSHLYITDTKNDSDFNQLIESIQADTNQLSSNIQERLNGDNVYKQVYFFEDVSNIINQLFELHHLETKELNLLIDNVIDELKYERLIFIVLICFLMSIIIYSFIMLYLNIKHNTERLKQSYRNLFIPQIKNVQTKYRETRDRLSQVERNLSYQVMKAHEEERKNVSRDIHDGIGQYLYSISVLLNLAKQHQTIENKDEAIENIQRVTNDALKEVKELSRRLRPSTLDDLGFIPALRSYLEDYRKTYQLHVKLVTSGDVGRLKPELETALYRICQEALTNISKYSESNEVEIVIDSKDNQIILTIEDNGKGFEVDKYLTSAHRQGIGLYSMKERAEALGGQFIITSKLNHGSKIEVIVPK